MRKRSKSPIEPTDLAGAFRRVMADYEDFVTAHHAADDRADPKAFAARHTAARTALGHLEHLMKLLGDDGAEAELTDLAGRLADARRNIAALPSEEAEDDDAG